MNRKGKSMFKERERERERERLMLNSVVLFIYILCIYNHVYAHCSIFTATLRWTFC